MQYSREPVQPSRELVHSSSQQDSNTRQLGYPLSPHDATARLYLRLLLETRVIDLDTVDTVFGRTAAHWAVYYKRYDLLLQLMFAG